MASEKQIQQWVKQFNQDGFLVIPNVLKPNQIDELRRDVDKIVKDNGGGKVHKRLFEKSDANLELFDQEPIVSFAEALFGDSRLTPDEADFTSTSLQCHVIHNNALVIPPRDKGIFRWHQDDPPHYIVEGEPPTNVFLPCLVFTANYYLSDVSRVENGPTAVIKGSHLWGKPCPSVIDPDEYDITHCTGSAGSVVLFNCQVWHRGSPNDSANTRYVAQITYGRRIIGHKYQPFMNYQMPEHVVEYVSEDKRLKRLAGFLDGGAYG